MEDHIAVTVLPLQLMKTVSIKLIFTHYDVTSGDAPFQNWFVTGYITCWCRYIVIAHLLRCIILDYQCSNVEYNDCKNHSFFGLGSLICYWSFQARILHESAFMSVENSQLEQDLANEVGISQQHPNVQELNDMHQDAADAQESRPIYEEDYLQEVDGLKAKYAVCDAVKETALHDGDVSCLATCSTGDIEDDHFNSLTSSYEAAGIEGENEHGALTSCVGTRWFRAPELLYGSTSYGLEVDLWSLGCIFAELLSLEPLFPGTSDLDQIAKIITVLGDMNEQTWPGCSNLPDYSKIAFNKIENPVGLEACLPNRSPSEVNIVRKLLCYDPNRRASAMELLSDGYFCEEPLPVPLNELRVPLKRDDHDESSGEEWENYRDMESDSDLEEFGKMDVVTTETGFSLKFV